MQRQRCPRLVPQPLCKDRSAADSSHGRLENTELRQNRATATWKIQKRARLERRPHWKDRIAPDSSHSHSEKTEWRNSVFAKWLWLEPGAILSFQSGCGSSLGHFCLCQVAVARVWGNRGCQMCPRHEPQPLYAVPRLRRTCNYREILTFQRFSNVTAGPHRESQNLENSRTNRVLAPWGGNCGVVRLSCGVADVWREWRLV